MKRRVGLCVLALTAALVAIDSAPAAATCATGVDGYLSGRGTYGAGGSSECSADAAGGTGAAGGGYFTSQTISDPVACAGTPDGRLVVRTHYDSTGTYLRTTRVCEGPLVPGDPGVPLPPAPESVFREAPLPLPEVHTSPPGRGLVGFETWLWWGADTELAPLSVGIAGWTATVTPQLERVEWDLGNGDVVVGDGAGSEERPSARYVYTEHCDCTITVTATWGGTVTLLHPLLGAPITQTVTGVGFSESLPYEVVQRQAVIVQ